MDLKDKKILLTGGGGFLGKFVFKKLLEHGAEEKNIFAPGSREHDLREKEICKKAVEGRDLILHLAASVGGLKFVRDFPGEAFYDSAAMSLNLIDAAYRAGVKKFVGVGSVCSYPKFAPLPFKEENLWDGYPEPDNAFYGLAKKFMLVQTQAYRRQYGFNGIHLLMVNLYGPGDNFNPERSHVIPALIRKIAEAKKASRDYIEVGGSGNASREFLYAEDAAEGIALAAMRYDKPEPVNLGSGEEISIRDLVATLCRLMDFKGEARWGANYPEGQPRRKFDVSKAQQEFGFKAATNLESGLKKTIEWDLEHE